jgi:hypothetical protein
MSGTREPSIAPMHGTFEMGPETIFHLIMFIAKRWIPRLDGILS